MSNTETLKHYLLEKENAYLLDENNNGKTIMLSGAWGSGKTHFWQKQIEPDLKTKLENKACLYVSLYGKDNLDSLKKEILINASSVDNLLSKEVASFGFDVLSSIKDSDLKIGQLFKAFSEASDTGKSSKGIEQLKDGGIICFDDFERKSEKINLNDLFGFISQLAIELNCKIIIILNSDVFTGKEAEIFNNVREKTISKFFYFNPTIEELFKSISDDTKYDELNKYKTDILSAIQETKELNARIYILVLNNCLEWLREYKDSTPKVLRTLILTTISSTRHNLWLSYPKKKHIPYKYLAGLNALFYSVMKSYPLEIIGILEELSTEDISIDDKEIYNKLIKNIVSQDEIKTPEMRLHYKEWCTKHKEELEILWKYGFKLNTFDSVDEIIYNKIYNFIETGILLP